MAPEYGATCGFFPIDDVTLSYMRLSGRSEEQVALVEAYAKAGHVAPAAMSRSLPVPALDMSSVEASLAGPKRPQDRVALGDVPKASPPAASWRLTTFSVSVSRLTIR